MMEKSEPMVVSDHEDDGDTSSGSDSELETNDYEKKREVALKRLIVLEKQFNSLREQLYNERIQQVETRERELREGWAQDYGRKTTRAEEEYGLNCGAAEMLRDKMMLATDTHRDEADWRAGKDSGNSRSIAYDRIKRDILAAIDKLKTDKMAADVNYALWTLDKESSSKSRAKSKAPKRGSSQVSGPCIVYLLNEEIIDNDWQTIRKAAIEADLIRAQDGY